MGQCESVEDFLSRGGAIEYCAPADERMMAAGEIDGPVSNWCIDPEFIFFETDKLKLMDPETFEFYEDRFFYPPKPSAE